MSGQDIAGPMARVYEKQGTSASTTTACRSTHPLAIYGLPKRSTLQQQQVMRNARLQYIISEYK
jgi:hypothetical protein